MAKNYYFVTLSENKMKVLCTLKTTPANLIEFLRGCSAEYLHNSRGFIFEDVFSKKIIHSKTIRDTTLGEIENPKAEGFITYDIDSQYIPSDEDLNDFLQSMTPEAMDKYRATMNDLENRAIAKKLNKQSLKDQVSDKINELTGNSRH